MTDNKKGEKFKEENRDDMENMTSKGGQATHEQSEVYDTTSEESSETGQKGAQAKAEDTDMEYED